MAQSRERTSFSCSAFDCQSSQPRVTMVITSINHSSDRSLSRPALTRSCCRWHTSFLRHAVPQLVFLYPAACAQGLPRTVPLPDPGVDAGGRKWTSSLLHPSQALGQKKFRMWSKILVTMSAVAKAYGLCLGHPVWS